MSKLRFEQYAGADIISAIVTSFFKERRKITHPCMIEALLAFIKNPDVELWYDGNHISQEYSENAIPLYMEGYKQLVESFQDLNELEQMYLYDYVNYHLNSKKQSNV